MMQRLEGKFARLMNLRWSRRGALFEGRFKSSLVDSEAYLLTCMRYIELNPVRAGMVEHAMDFPWSSYRENAAGNPSGILRPHPLYLRLAEEPVSRGAAYRRLHALGVTEEDLTRIRLSAAKCRVLGDESFHEKMSEELARPVAPRARGRPKKGDRPENASVPI